MVPRAHRSRARLAAGQERANCVLDPPSCGDQNVDLLPWKTHTGGDLERCVRMRPCALHSTHHVVKCQLSAAPVHSRPATTPLEAAAKFKFYFDAVWGVAVCLWGKLEKYCKIRPQTVVVYMVSDYGLLLPLMTWYSRALNYSSRFWQQISPKLPVLRSQI